MQLIATWNSIIFLSIIQNGLKGGYFINLSVFDNLRDYTVHSAVAISYLTMRELLCDVKYLQ